MNISLFISRFIYRIRYRLLIGSIVVTCLVAYFTQFLPKSYTVKTTIYTGIVSGSSIIEGENPSFNVVNNSFDNLINLVKAQSTIEKVALKLFATNMIKGNAKEDNEFITAKNFQQLKEIVPEDVLNAIDKSSVDNTVSNLKQMNKYGGHNFIYSLLNGNHKHYSYNALERVLIKRVQNSDLLEISYTSDDPGVTTNTVKFFNEELLSSYNELRYNSTDDVIKYFEREVAKLKSQLNKKEDGLTDYNVENSVINYEEQTKFIAEALIRYEDRLEDAEKRYRSSTQLLLAMEKQMDARTKLYYTNKDFLKALDDISTIKGKITDIEMFTTEDAQKKDSELANYQARLRKRENDISDLSKNMDQLKYSKEGLAISEMSINWLNALIENTKVSAELEVLKDRRLDFDDKYARYSPVGTELKRRERDINVSENSYLEMLHALNLAYLRKKNIQLTTSNLNTITPPTFPLSPNKSKRMLFIIAAFFGSLIFITLYKLIIELLDRTLRDADRAKNLTGLSPVAAFVGRGELRYRGYSKTWNRKAATYLAAKITSNLSTSGPSFINLFSINSGEGKTFISKYLSEEFERLGLSVKRVALAKDDVEDKTFILANNFSSIIPTDELDEYNIFIIEYPAFIQNSTPKSLITGANLNLIVTNARRVWKKSDDEILSYFKEVAGDSKYKLLLNNADRYDVEDFTGGLPPFKSGGILTRYFMHMGLTSKKDTIN